METLLRCKVYPGQFSGEYAVSADATEGRFSLFVPEQHVSTDETPTRDRPVDGWMKVVLLEQSERAALVRLPRESFESGRYVTVALDHLRSRPEPVGADR